ncbi:histidine phosphatase family protein [Companilactobacillus halodurans]|uniref:Histidine phosphatase family protein n=1 Tax=Companilactobacillus halodurans TaxID=2584183 RepID=A0A5P0ZX97_9LACO|nr:histidine phosphatase family protein [Companilactobacillus halodurans]MQS75248.1 histidine phosphatase family protein [Companilactobacillus halodurans]MQS97597.1 histidine phosphatase family protein [Companilactobacillus halodurans]
MNIYFIRHGETYFNHLRKMQGWSDTPLTKAGHEEAYRMGRTLKNLGELSDTIYCSDMNRSVQTVTELNNGAKAAGGKTFKMVTMPELREQFYGSFEGQSKKETYQKIIGKSVEETFKELSANEIQDKIAKLDPANLAETSSEFWARFAKGIEKIDQAEKKPVIVVTHSAILTALVDTYAHDMLSQIEPNNLSLTKIHLEGDKFEPHVVYYNQKVEQNI